MFIVPELQIKVGKGITNNTSVWAGFHLCKLIVILLTVQWVEEVKPLKTKCSDAISALFRFKKNSQPADSTFY